MARLVLFSLVVAALALTASADAGKELAKKYGMMKIFESCFGPRLHKEYLMKMKSAAMMCKGMPTNYKRPIATATRASLASSLSASGSSPSLLGGLDFSEILKLQNQQSGSGSSGGRLTYVPVFIPNRKKRQIQKEKYFNANMIRKLGSKMRAKVSNMTCIMRELGYMDNNDEILYDEMINEIRRMDVEYQLKEDLEESVRDCRSFTECMPIDQKDMPFTPQVKRLHMFNKCTMKHKLMACMKKDLREKSEMFEFNGLGDFMQGADEDEKMLALVWAKTSFGDDPFEFCSLGIDGLENDGFDGDFSEMTEFESLFFTNEDNWDPASSWDSTDPNSANSQLDSSSFPIPTVPFSVPFPSILNNGNKGSDQVISPASSNPDSNFLLTLLATALSTQTQQMTNSFTPPNPVKNFESSPDSLSLSYDWDPSRPFDSIPNKMSQSNPWAFPPLKGLSITSSIAEESHNSKCDSSINNNCNASSILDLDTAASSSAPDDITIYDVMSLFINIPGDGENNSSSVTNKGHSLNTTEGSTVQEEDSVTTEAMDTDVTLQTEINNDFPTDSSLNVSDLESSDGKSNITASSPVALQTLTTPDRQKVESTYLDATSPSPTLPTINIDEKGGFTKWIIETTKYLPPDLTSSGSSVESVTESLITDIFEGSSDPSNQDDDEVPDYYEDDQGSGEGISL